jgi:hypothetical protein
MIITKVSKDFWRLELRRLELRSGDDKLIWYAPTRTEVRGKYQRWARDKKLDKINSETPQPTIAADSVAHLE